MGVLVDDRHDEDDSEIVLPHPVGARVPARATYVLVVRGLAVGHQD